MPMIASLPGVFAGRVWQTLAPSRVCELRSRLEAEKQELHKFSGALEEEFLELGGLLRRIGSLAREVRYRFVEVPAAASGRIEENAMRSTFQLVKKAGDLAQATREKYRQAFAVFERMHSGLMWVARERSAWMRTLAARIGQHPVSNPGLRLRRKLYYPETFGRILISIRNSKYENTDR